MMIIAVSTAVGSSFTGVYVSFFINASTGACIVLLQAAVFVVALFLAPKHGLIAARRQRLVASVPAAR
jgi:ABC-type Mn2+/Zn2+ transport system permease subunit